MKSSSGIRQLVERHFSEIGLPESFKTYAVHYNVRHKANIWRGMNGHNSIKVSVNDGVYPRDGDPFMNSRVSNLDFSYNIDLGILDGVHIRIWPPHEGNGYAPRMIEAMHEVGRHLDCSHIYLSIVTNEGFWRDRMKYVAPDFEVPEGISFVKGL